MFIDRESLTKPDGSLNNKNRQSNREEKKNVANKQRTMCTVEKHKASASGQFDVALTRLLPGHGLHLGKFDIMRGEEMHKKELATPREKGAHRCSDFGIPLLD